MGENKNIIIISTYPTFLNILCFEYSKQFLKNLLHKNVVSSYRYLSQLDVNTYISGFKQSECQLSTSRQLAGNLLAVAEWPIIKCEARKETRQFSACLGADFGTNCNIIINWGFCS